MNKKFNLTEIEALLSYINKRAEKGNYKKSLLIKLKHNFMFKTKIDINNAKEMILYKDIESTIQGLEALFNKEEEYFCLNCGEQIYFPDSDTSICGEQIYFPDSDTSICENCNWINEVNDTPSLIEPITIITDNFQVSYPPIEETDLEEIPEKLKESIITYFKHPENFAKKHRDNIYHNLYKKNAISFEKIARKYQNKAKLVRYFQNSDLFTDQLENRLENRFENMTLNEIVGDMWFGDDNPEEYNKREYDEYIYDLSRIFLEANLNKKEIQYLLNLNPHK